MNKEARMKNDQVMNYQKISNGVVFNTGIGKLQLQIHADNIIRVTFFPNDLSPIQSLIVLENRFKKTGWEIAENKDEYIISTARILAKLSKKDGLIVFTDLKNKVLLKEDENNTRVFTPDEVCDEKVFNIMQGFIITNDEGLYGLGQIPDGNINHRGKKEVLLVQSNKNAVIPFLISSKPYGILWDNCSKTRFSNLNNNEMHFWSEVGESIDYYFITGENIDEVISGYRFLTGKSPLFGKWAYGYWQSKERYINREQVLSVAKEYRDRNIPIDNIVQDWRYWGENPNWSSMEWDETIYPNPKEMIDILHDKYKMHFMISIWPSLGKASKLYKEMDENNFLYNNDDLWMGGRVYDAFIPEARDLYWKYMNKGLFSIGVDAWWMDATEPEFHGTATQEDTELGIKRCKRNWLGNIARTLNAFSLVTTKGVYESQRSVSSDKRVFILTRSGFAGQQRNASVTWSGDIGASWKIFREQISAGLNFSMAGVPYWTVDIGAFFPDYFGGNYPNGVDDPAYRELYVRWFQFGAFLPIFRAHGTVTPREIWQFGEPGTNIYEALVKMNVLRYRLINYIYSLAWQVTNNDYTMLRGLIMDFSNDKNIYNIDNEYMFGPSILVAPVVNEMYTRTKPLGEIISSENLCTSDGKTGGITGEYFSDINFEKQLHTQKDEKIDFAWGIAFPKGITKHNFGVRWKGQIITVEEGVYEFALRCDDHVRLWINDELLIDKWTLEGAKINSKTINLEANTKYNLKVDFIQTKSDSLISLIWNRPGQLNEYETPEELTNKTNIYLPADNYWYDFWTGKKYKGGETIEREVPIDILPLYIKAGSIIPMAPKMQYATEKPFDPVELRIYPGNDAETILYEDENDNYNYEKGVNSKIKINWNDLNKILTIGKREGEFPGMLMERKFEIVLVKESHGEGIEPAKPDKIAKYSGEEIIVEF